MLLSLDFVYVPTPDVDAAVRYYVEVLGAHLEWKVHGMGTTVARVDVTTGGPPLLLSGHLEGDVPVLIYRVADYAAAIASLRAAGVDGIRELEIPHGPCASFETVDGQRIAIYQLTRPGADAHFAIDP